MSTTNVTLALFALVPSLLAVEIRTLDGKLYEDCQVSLVEPDAICVLFPGGGARIKFVNLGEDVRAKYGYDPVKAAEYEQVQAARKEREDAYWRAVRAHQQARRQADRTNSVEHAKVAAADADEDSSETSPRRTPAAYGSSGGGRGGYGGSSGGGYQNQTYGGSAEYVGVELAPRVGQAYGQSGGFGQGNQGGSAGGYGGGGWGGGGTATYVGVQLAPRRFGGGFGGGGGGAGGGFGQGYR